MSSRQERCKPKTVWTARGKPFPTGPCLIVARCLPVRVVLMMRLRMARLNMVSHRGVPLVAAHVSERDRRRSQPAYVAESKNLLERVFHGPPGAGARFGTVQKCDQ